MVHVIVQGCCIVTVKESANCSNRCLKTICGAGDLKEFKAYRKWAREVSKTPRHPNPFGPPK
jgi:hypothetical protein